MKISLQSLNRFFLFHCPLHSNSFSFSFLISWIHIFVVSNLCFLFLCSHFLSLGSEFNGFFFFDFSFLRLDLCFLNFIEEICAWRLVFWNSIHQEVASDSFCFLLYSSWLIVFILYVFEHYFSFINLYCWKGLHFS